MSKHFDIEHKITPMSEKKHSTSSTPPISHVEDMGGPDARYRQTSVVGEPPHAEHGPTIDHKIPEADVVQAQPDLWWSRTRRTLREPFAEFWGVFILIMFGDGVVAQVVLSKGKNGDYQSISWGWG